MSVDFNATPLNTPTTGETDAPMFAPIPSWERNRKRKGFGGKSSSAATIQVGAPVADTTSASYAAPLDTPNTFAAAPAFASRPVKKGRTGLPMAVAAGIVAIGGLAAAGWYASQPHETGIATLTPGTEAAALPAAAPVMATAPILPVEVKTPAAATPARATTRVATATPARARPAASRSAADAGVNTAASLPSAPQPYSGQMTAPAAPAGAAPVIAAPAWNIPPKAEAPAPAPVEAAPAPVITTPQVQTPPN